MSDYENLRFTVKAVINKQKNRVLFAEIDDVFTRLLLCCSTQSLVLIIRALLMHLEDKTPVIGCLNNLYKSFTKLYNDVVHFALLRKYDIFSQCAWFHAFPSGNISSYIICEDLRIMEVDRESIFESLSNVGFAVEDIDGAETKIVTFGVNEILDFLVRLFISPCPLSDIILGTAVNSELPKIKAEVGIPLQHLKKDSTSSGKMMILKLTIQKSTNKLLFAQADQDFVNYLFSLLLIPLGRVNYHLGSNTCPKNVDTLFTSITDLAREYFHNMDTLMATKFPLEMFFDDGMFMITDDLSVTRFSLVSRVSVLDELKISLSDVKEVELQIGIEEVLSILKASLTSTRALTDGLINSRLKKQLTTKQEK